MNKLYINSGYNKKVLKVTLVGLIMLLGISSKISTSVSITHPEKDSDSSSIQIKQNRCIHKLFFNYL